jgi:exonuclease VII large subunit
MKPNTNTEAAETDQTTDSQAVVQQRLARLLARFRGFVSARREAAEHWRAKGESRVAASSDRSADFFERCADELERTINGEMPPDPGYDWPISQTNAESIHPDS